MTRLNILRVFQVRELTRTKIKAYKISGHSTRFFYHSHIEKYVFSLFASLTISFRSTPRSQKEQISTGSEGFRAPSPTRSVPRWEGEAETRPHACAEESSNHTSSTGLTPPTGAYLAKLRPLRQPINVSLRDHKCAIFYSVMKLFIWKGMT